MVNKDEYIMYRRVAR